MKKKMVIIFMVGFHSMYASNAPFRCSDAESLLLAAADVQPEEDELSANIDILNPSNPFRLAVTPAIMPMGKPFLQPVDGAVPALDDPLLSSPVHQVVDNEREQQGELPLNERFQDLLTRSLVSAACAIIQHKPKRPGDELEQMVATAAVRCTRETLPLVKAQSNPWASANEEHEISAKQPLGGKRFRGHKKYCDHCKVQFTYWSSRKNKHARAKGSCPYTSVREYESAYRLGTQKKTSGHCVISSFQ